MRHAPALQPVTLVGARREHRPARATWLQARLRAQQLDRELAAGIAPWRSPVHAARALQLTSHRNRRGLARSLERLVELAEQPPARLGAAIPPCREQVRDALPAIMAISSRLRSADPIDARGVTRLRGLVSDGCGPCYLPGRPDALRDALKAASQWLAVTD